MRIEIFCVLNVAMQNDKLNFKDVAHKTSLTPPPLLVQSQESERSCKSVLLISVLPLFLSFFQSSFGTDILCVESISFAGFCVLLFYFGIVFLFNF